MAGYLPGGWPASYISQVRAIAPSHLMGREQELELLAAFCEGDDAYQWWQGAPWAGKTGLAAWFVLHPPREMTIASFFVTGRLDGQADCDAFTRAMSEQLAALASLPAPRDVSRGAQKDVIGYLIEAAARRVCDGSRRLVLVVDGLDEDVAFRPGTDLAPIVSLLPERLPDGVRILVTSREHPPIAAVLPSGHPLRTCPRRTLRAYAGAGDAAAEAEREMRQKLQENSGDRDIVALIAVAGGGLAAEELAELTGQSPSAIDAHLRSAFGRSLSTRQVPGSAEPVYIFAHETLHAAAQRALSAELQYYRGRFHDWAEEYRGLGWPRTTPRYLLEPYARMLSAAGDAVNLARLAAEKQRHDRMLKCFESDTEALAEITAAQDLLMREDEVDLTAMLLVAAEKNRLKYRNQYIPSELPAVWARLGKSAYAVNLARSISDPDGRSDALAAVATAISLSDPVQAGGLAREAERILRQTGDSGAPQSMANVAGAMAVAGEWGRAEAIARLVTADLRERARAFGEVAAAVAVGDPKRAVHLAGQAAATARSMAHAPYRAQALARVAAALARSFPNRARLLAGEAERTARESAKPESEAEELAVIAGILAVGHPSRAARLAREAERLARGCTDFWRERRIAFAAKALAAVGLYDRVEGAVGELYDPDHREAALEDLAQALAGAGFRDRAEYTVDEISPWRKARALTRIAAVLADSDPGNATRIAAEAIDAARLAADSDDEDRLLARIAQALAAAGHRDRAETAAAGVASSSLRAQAFSMIATIIADSHPESADRIARQAIFAARDVSHPTMHQMALRDVSVELAKGSLVQCAQDAAMEIEDQWARVMALAEIASVISRGNPESSARIARQVYQSVSEITDPHRRPYGLLAATRALSGAGLWDEAGNAASGIESPDTRADALTAMVRALAANRLFDQAEQLANTIDSLPRQAHALAVVAAAAASADPGEASRVARNAWQAATECTDAGWRTEEAMIEVSKELGAAGQWNTADSAARSIDSSYKRQQAFAGITEALARAGRWRQALSLSGEILEEALKADALTAIGAALLDARKLNAAASDDAAPNISTCSDGYFLPKSGKSPW